MFAPSPTSSRRSREPLRSRSGRDSERISAPIHDPVRLLGKAAAVELAGSNIRVNVVAPGPVETGLLRRMVAGQIPLERIARAVPMQRIAAPSEIAAAILWLCSH